MARSRAPLAWSHSKWLGAELHLLVATLNGSEPSSKEEDKEEDQEDKDKDKDKDKQDKDKEDKDKDKDESI